MLKRFAKLSIPLLALAGFALVAAPKASAAPTLQLKADVTLGTAATLSVVDNSAPDQDATLGSILLGTGGVFSFGDFNVTESRSVSNAQSPPPTPLAPVSSGAILRSNANVVTNPTNIAQQITLRVSDINFSGPLSPLIFNASANGLFQSDNNTTVNGSSFRALAWYDTGNVLFGSTLPASSVSVFSPTAHTVQDYTKPITDADAGYTNTVITAPVPVTGLYSLTVELIFTLAPHTSLINRGDAISSKTAVPEPATMASLGLGLVAALGFGLRRRFTA